MQQQQKKNLPDKRAYNLQHCAMKSDIYFEAVGVFVQQQKNNINDDDETGWFWHSNKFASPSSHIK